MRVGNDLARRGSPLLFSTVPAANSRTVLFELWRRGSLASSDYLQFTMNNNGEVIPTTSAQGAIFSPSSVPLNNVTQHWIEEVADEEFRSIAENRGIPVPD